jgi:putative endonuclease
MFYLYFLRCNDGSLYCGQTKDLDRRIKEHNEDKHRSAKYLRGKKPFKLVYVVRYKTLSSALKREYEIKQMTKKEKEELIMSRI